MGNCQVHLNLALIKLTFILILLMWVLILLIIHVIFFIVVDGTRPASRYGEKTSTEN